MLIFCKIVNRICLRWIIKYISNVCKVKRWKEDELFMLMKELV